jgi:hypothetical protein
MSCRPFFIPKDILCGLGFGTNHICTRPTTSKIGRFQRIIVKHSTLAAVYANTSNIQHVKLPTALLGFASWVHWPKEIRDSVS